MVSDQAGRRSLAVCISLMGAVERGGDAGIVAKRWREEMMEGAKERGTMGALQCRKGGQERETGDFFFFVLDRLG